MACSSEPVNGCGSPREGGCCRTRCSRGSCTTKQSTAQKHIREVERFSAHYVCLSVFAENACRLLWQLVIQIPDGKYRLTAEPHIGNGLVKHGQVELANFLVLMMDLRALGPERGVLRRLGRDARNSKILRIDPDRSPVKELGFA